MKRTKFRQNLTRQWMMFLTSKSESVTQAMLKQRYIVKFLFKEGNKPPNIIQR
jgi:hypothetical protein